MESIINEFNDVKGKNPIIKIIGVGGGGGNAVNNMFKSGLEGVSYLLINTDATDLNNSPVEHKIALASLGAGNEPSVAEEAALKAEDEIKQAVNDGTKMAFITACMGGGTGTGASPVVARILKEMGILVVGIVTIPFAFEGRKKIRKALSWIETMTPYVDSLLVINNERLTQFKDFKLPLCFQFADNVLLNAARSISNIINVPGYINIDFADVKTTLLAGKMAVISTGEGDGEERIKNAIADAQSSLLLNNKNIWKSQKILLNFYCSEDYAIEGGEVDQIREFVDQMENDMDVIWGVTYDNDLDTRVKVTLLASGEGTICPKEYEAEYEKIKLKKELQEKENGEYDLSQFDTDDGTLAEMKVNDAITRMKNKQK
ncbi:MAG: cell division FtsZ family protein [Paludibacteraceae bacterium]|nr:cell division FtsZ family protein [Paludibacteraceae bacterium]